MMSKRVKIAMFGGSYNPPHAGHIDVAEHIRSEFGIDRFLFVVAADPPHKTIAGNVDGYTRFELVSLAVEGHEGLEASDIELSRDGKSYTYMTLEKLKTLYPDAELYLVVGEDMLEDLPTWRNVGEIFSLAGIISASRPGSSADIQRTAERISEEFGADIRVASFAGPDISSTEIRKRLFDARPITGLVPAKTEKYIYDKLLYQPDEVRRWGDAVRSRITPSRYRHSVGVMQTAIKLAHDFGADGSKARCAALLHDCSKIAGDELIKLALEYGIKTDEYDEANPSMLHDRVGAEYARRMLGVTDTEVLDAIINHTRCRTGMSKLEKIIYLADKIEPSRKYEGVCAIRKAAETDLDRAMLMCLERSLDYLKSNGDVIQPNIFGVIAELKEGFANNNG